FSIKKLSLNISKEEFTMRYVEYGKTGKMVSVVGYGGLRFDLEKSNQENADLVKYAYEKVLITLIQHQGIVMTEVKIYLD
ncbi:aldo/keto reductase domain protein, partial [Clostridioides difficile CD42]